MNESYLYTSVAIKANVVPYAGSGVVTSTLIPDIWSKELARAVTEKIDFGIINDSAGILAPPEADVPYDLPPSQIDNRDRYIRSLLGMNEQARKSDVPKDFQWGSTKREIDL